MGLAEPSHVDRVRGAVHPHDLITPKGPPPSTMALGLSFCRCAFWRDLNIWTAAESFIILGGFITKVIQEPSYCKAAFPRHLLFFFFLLFRTAPTAYGSLTLARGPIGAAAASLHHSHSNARSQPRLRPIYTTAHSSTGSLITE